MPKRDDIQTILVIGSGPIVIGQACEFDYSGAQACKVLKADGYRVVLVNSNPATIMTDPGLADRTYVEPITVEFVEQVIAKERPDALLPTLGGQTGLNTAVELAKSGILDKYGVEMIGCDLAAIERGEDRKLFNDCMAELGIETARSGYAYSVADAEAIVGEAGLSRGAAPLVHAGRRGRRHRARPRRASVHRGAGPGAFPGRRGAGGGKHRGLEGIRDGGHARPCRQRHHRVLHRELRRHGGAYGRLHHGGARADALRRGVPAHARRVAGHPGEDRRGDRRLQRAVRRQPGKRPHDRHRDEPARVAFLGAGVEGHGIPHREGRGEAGRGLHA